MGDVDKIKQILVNILNNSIEVTQDGRIDINVSHSEQNRNHDPDTEYIHFTIKDTGNGMDGDIESQVNNLLKTTNNLTGREQKKKLRGFGLYISYHLCMFLKGKMWFCSVPDMGTKFHVIIPLKNNVSL